MKRIILSEGENDTIFLKELLIKKLAIEENKVLFFDQNSQDIEKNLKHLEDKYFRKLSYDWSPYELLVKSEGGKTKIIGVTVSKLPDLCEKGYDPIMLIDLEDGKMESFTNGLQQKLIGRFRGIRLTTEPKELHKIDDAVMHSIRLLKNNDELIGTVYIIGFCKTLERVTGINNSTHSDTDKKSISQTYIKGSQIHELFSKALTCSVKH